MPDQLRMISCSHGLYLTFSSFVFGLFSLFFYYYMKVMFFFYPSTFQKYLFTYCCSLCYNLTCCSICPKHKDMQIVAIHLIFSPFNLSVSTNSEYGRHMISCATSLIHSLNSLLDSKISYCSHLALGKFNCISLCLSNVIDVGLFPIGFLRILSFVLFFKNCFHDQRCFFLGWYV